MRRRYRTNTRQLLCDPGLKCPEVAKPFASDDELLQAMLAMLQSRSRLHDALEKADLPEEDRRRVRAEESAWTRYWHASFRKTRLPVLIADQGNRLRLNWIEREILAALVLDHLAMFPEHFNDTRGLFKVLTRPGSQVLDGFRALSEHGRW